MAKTKYSLELDKVATKKEVKSNLSQNIRLALAYSKRKQNSLRSLGSSSSASRKVSDPLLMTLEELIDLSYELNGVLKFTIPLNFDKEILKEE